MPQPLPKSFVATVSFDDDVLEKRPKCAVKIAEISNDWVRVEHELANMFAVSVGVSIPTGIDTWRSDPNKAAWGAITSIDSLSARLGMITGAFEEAGLSDELKLRFGKLATRIRKVAGSRNDVIHGLWGSTPKYPNDLVLRSKPQAADLRRYTETDLEAIKQAIKQIRRELVDFRFRATSHQAGVKIPWPDN
jgi:hypothetical protein